MQLLIGECEVFYRGRGHTWLPPYKRMVIIKDDGSIAVHSDSKYQPLNYMPKTDHIDIGKRVVEAVGNNEVLRIEFSGVVEYHDISLNVGENTDPGLVRSGTEKHLQQWLESHLYELSENLEFMQSEYNTGNGAVDILAMNVESRKFAVVEVKRVATSTAITQVRRYVEAMVEQDKDCDPVIIALEFKPRAVELAAKHGIRLIVAPPNYWENDLYKLPTAGMSVAEAVARYAEVTGGPAVQLQFDDDLV